MSSPPHLSYTDTRREHIRRILVKLYHILESNIAALMGTEDPGADPEPKRADWTPEEVKDHKNVSIKWGVLKQTYNTIVTYRSKSGEHWDNERGANISGALAAESWSKYVAVKANAQMKPFRNKGWEYLEFLEDIFPQGGATSTHAFHAGASNPVFTTNIDGSSVSGTTPTPIASIGDHGDSIPISVMPVGSLALIANPPTSDPPATTSGGKRSFNAMSADVTDTAPPSLFSNNLPPATTMSSVPKTKRSRTSSSKAKANPPASSQTVAVIAVDNTIRHFHCKHFTVFLQKTC
ncbi:hypothetical protein PISMIDRAFT_15155 [Pisolithus microcarpus 441]|uniref:Myb/SANT-like domain-containing protein n=1 Tax=Pisolithus microcarpus 441 TaxID=765257 RepID=A0A0C9YTL9_9AGAM|nr:hypothetical protein PISMIDRAFT_15155 [Pisolithus microcarpus 441]